MILAHLLYPVSLAAISRLDAPGGCCSVVQSVECQAPVSSLIYTDSDKQTVPDFLKAIVLLSQPSPLIIQPKVTCLSYLLCGDHCLPPTEVSPLGFKFYPRQKQ
ncbi:hypothetical protein CHARACLAT_025258 [Characodon lateralis]|uniref:Uncharacterized protein n=1 Tax=Characodon lateralis TaxID=208331 RepID=A0ABU7D4S8_9TELE|nr:hypothetical protein [Characodon lateralis]